MLALVEKCLIHSYALCRVAISKALQEFIPEQKGWGSSQLMALGRGDPHIREGWCTMIIGFVVSQDIYTGLSE